MISNQKFMRIAFEVASESKAVKRKVGAVIVKDNNIIALGYNGTPSGFDNCCEDKVETGYVTDEGCALQIPEYELKTRPEVLHAESNAISKCARSTYSSEGSILYTTTSPCLECSKLIIQAGIKKVYWHDEYRSEDGIKLLIQAGIEVERIQSLLETITLGKIIPKERVETDNPILEKRIATKNCTMKGKGFCPYEESDGACNLVGNCKNHDDLPMIDSVNCPNCETYISESSFISRTDAEFHEEPDPHYAWEETHECVKCETKFRLRNST
jgi:dCMP deaminase